jgi:hypothetical protein
MELRLDTVGAILEMISDGNAPGNTEREGEPLPPMGSCYQQARLVIWLPVEHSNLGE